MLKILSVFFTALGVIFFLIILAGVYLYIADPLNVKPLFMEQIQEETPPGAATEQTDKNILLSPVQEKALETFGVDPASLPSSITPEQEACFVKVLGGARVEEIKAGSTPTVTEFLTAKSCL